ncbi:hypothetical protein T484DRAFT_1858389, partial [Baffinella frigidus]
DNADCAGFAPPGEGFTCSCTAGYENTGSGTGAGVVCTDINECDAEANPCRAGACSNAAGTYSCACNAGYEGVTVPGTCTDIDECAQGSPCGDNAACTNNDTPGANAYTCECNAGYENTGGSGASFVCTVINSPSTTTGETAAEPTTTTSTPAPTTTTSTPAPTTTTSTPAPTTTTTSTPGPTTTPSTTPEPDSDECALGTHNCDVNASCTNDTTSAGYTCACDDGYTGDGVNCTAIDETGDGVGDPCVKNRYAEGCTETCTMEGTCSRHGRCLGDGSCECFPGFSGESCEPEGGGGDPCVKNRYAEGCTETCTMEGTCSRHGRCLGDGSCECFPGFSGESCEPEGGGGDPCVKNRYAEGCTETCTMEGTCSRHGRCMGDGSCECFDGWEGPSCSIQVLDPCVKNLYTEECTAPCKMSVNCSRHGRCMGDGSCECFDGWSGAHCGVQDVTFINTTASCIMVPGFDVCVCAAGFTGQDGGPCEACQLGAYKVGNGSGGCQLCDDGTYATSMPGTSDSACKVCPADSWCTAGLRNACPSSLESLEGTSSVDGCTCPAGEELKFGACQSCTAGYFCPGGGVEVQPCPDTFESAGGIQSEDDCKCAAGREFVEASNDCQSCAAGYYTDVPGRSACQPCDSGTSNDGDGTQCFPCEAGSFCSGGAASQPCPNTFVSAVGSWSEDDCTCAAGREFVDDGNGNGGGSCQACGVGTFKDVGDGPCCAAGERSDGETCSPCPPGDFGDGVGGCQACPDNSGSSAGSETADDCTCNIAWEKVGGSCRLCTANFFCEGGGGAVQPCPNNLVSEKGSSIDGDCTCAAGLEYVADSNDCQSCAAGTVKDDLGRDACSTCPANSFCSGGAASELCPSHAGSAPGSQSVAACTCMEGYNDAGAGGAAVCVERELDWSPWSIERWEDADPHTFQFYEIRALRTNTYTASLTLLAGNASALFNESPAQSVVHRAGTNGVVWYGEVDVAVRPDMNGVTTWTVAISDPSYAGGPPAMTQSMTITITVLAVNDAPSFGVVQSSFFSSANDAWLELPFAINMSKGPLNEDAQAFTFVVTQVGGPTKLFSSVEVQHDGSLKAKIGPTLGFEGSGNTTWEVVLKDDGGTARDGVDSSAPQTVTIELFKRPAAVQSLTLTQQLPSVGASTESIDKVVAAWSVDGLSNVAGFTLVLRASIGWNETRHVGANVCSSSVSCSAVFEDLDWLEPGTTLTVEVQAHNAMGSSDPVLAPRGKEPPLLLVGPPTAPRAVVVSQTTAPSAPGTLATRFGVVWSAPGDYGDGRAANNTDRTTLLGYNVVVWCGGGTRAAPILVGASLT